MADVLAGLTNQQANGVRRIVEAELDGKRVVDLLDCPDQICASTTYYNKRGWKHKPAFQQALKLARRDYRRWLLEVSTGETLTILARTSPEAARALQQQIVGDGAAIAALEVALYASEVELRANAARRLGETGLPVVVPALVAAWRREKELDVRKAIIAALGQVAGLRDPDRRVAATSVLDRAAVETAAKQGVAIGELPEDVTDDELEAIERALAQASGGEQAPGGGEAE